MKIARIESLHADATWRPFDFLEITADSGLVGWRESNESFGGPGVSALATMMSARFAALVPNLRIVEIDPDVVPWHDDLVTAEPDIRDGHLRCPPAPAGAPRSTRPRLAPTRRAPGTDRAAVRPMGSRAGPAGGAAKPAGPLPVPPVDWRPRGQ